MSPNFCSGSAWLSRVWIPSSSVYFISITSLVEGKIAGDNLYVYRTLGILGSFVCKKKKKTNKKRFMHLKSTYNPRLDCLNVCLHWLTGFTALFPPLNVKWKSLKTIGRNLCNINVCGLARILGPPIKTWLCSSTSGHKNTHGVHMVLTLPCQRSKTMGPVWC